MSKRILMLCLPLLILLLVSCWAVADGVSDNEVSIEKRDGLMVVNVAGKRFTEYDFQKYARPIFFPVFGAGQVPMTRGYPMREIAGEASDHPHHKSIWFAHGAVDGIDFWKEAGSIKHVSLDAFDADRGFSVTDHWMHPKTDKVLLVVTGKFEFGADDSSRWIDCEYVLKPAEKEVLLGDTKEGTFAIRTHPDLRLVANEKQGVKQVFGNARNSAGDTGKPIWGKSAKWVDYFGAIDGKQVGIAMFDHPSNLRHPTTWHAREYGLVAANPFGLHYFKRQKKGAGDYRLQLGSSLKLRYRIVFYEGQKTDAEIEQYYTEFTKQ